MSCDYLNIAFRFCNNMPRKKSILKNVGWGEVSRRSPDDRDTQKTTINSKELYSITMNELERYCRNERKEYLNGGYLFVYKKDTTENPERCFFTIIIAPITILQINSKGLFINNENSLNRSKVSVNILNKDGAKPSLIFNVIMNNRNEIDEIDEDDIYKTIIKDVLSKNRQTKDRINKILKEVIIIENLNLNARGMNYKVKILLERMQDEKEILKGIARGIVDAMLLNHNS